MSESGKPLDSDEKTARDLQWNSLLKSISQRCCSEEAAQRLSLLWPFATLEEAAAAQQWVREGLALLAISAPLPVRAVPRVDQVWSALPWGAAATKEQLRDLARMLEQSGRLRAHLNQHQERAHTLKQRLWSDPALDSLKERVRRAIDERGEILDSASEGLRAARRSLETVRSQLKTQLNRLISRYSPALAGHYFADRDGRYVLPVRIEAQSQVEGIVLGASGSGGTLYVEPRELTELNNRLRVSEANVVQEEFKVLLALSQAAIDLLPQIQTAYETCVFADQTAAVTLWANQHGAKPVYFTNEHQLQLVQFRHPLLLEQGEPVVANDLRLDAAQCLITSGPNAGGKTVALTCLGLAVWMAQSGLPLPCDRTSRIGWFKRVLTDVGDDQSLSRSLSTFSAHVTKLTQCLNAAEPGVLVLLDEIAGGTDPDEGAALAEAVLEGLVEAGASVATTTHYERLKKLGARGDARFVNASVGFDLSEMRPTFTLTLGVPGASSAFTVAERYGIPKSIVDHARALIPSTQLAQQQLLEQLETERQRLEQLRRQAEEELQKQQALNRQLASETERAFEQERTRLRKEAESLTQEVKASRLMLRKAQLSIEQSQMPRAKADLRAVEQTISGAAKPIAVGSAIHDLLTAVPTLAPPDPSRLSPGTRVRIPHLNAIGEVLESPSRDQVRLQVGAMKLSVPVAQVQLEKSSSRKQQKKKPTVVTPQPALRSTPARTSENVCDLRGVRVEAGLDQVEQFLDRMLQNGESSAFILHGHGTGAMKNAVREHLPSLRHVEHWEPAPPEEGGDALTVVWLYT